MAWETSCMCASVICAQYGCQRTAPCQPFQWGYIPPLPQGCVCPAGAEKSCRGDCCPRQPRKPIEVIA